MPGEDGFGIKMFKLGLKVWSSNLQYIQPALDLYQEKVFDYIELFVDPRVDTSVLPQWRTLAIPFHLHAPHFYAGLNFSDPAYLEKNRLLLHKVDMYRETLSPQWIVFHPGVNGELQETIQQIKMFKNEFPQLFTLALIENKPKIGIRENDVCLGSSAQEIKMVLSETGLGFCLDMGHAICFANWARRPWENVIQEFLKLLPKVYHISDGDNAGVIDRHEHFGDGDFDLKKIISMLDPSIGLTIETKKDSQSNLDDFKKDALYIKSLCQKIYQK